MTFELGRAQFIIESDSDEALADGAKYFNETTKQARALTKELAKELKVRQSDVKSAASVIIAEEKKLAREREKIAKEGADARKKHLVDTIKNEVAELKRREKAEKDFHINQLREAKLQSSRALEIERQQLRQSANLRRQEEQKRRDDERRRSSATTVERFARGIPGDLATIAGFGAIASGAIIVREALVKLTEATLKQQEAQRGLNAAFGQTQILFKQNAEALAKQFNLVTSEVEKASTRFGVLRSQTHLTGVQIRELQAGVIELQAAFGGDLQEAFRASAGAVLGETEAFEKFGLVLQEGVLKSSSLLTEEERRRFTTMSESEKQMIRYRLIMEHVTTVQGAAAKRAKEAQGGFDALNRSTDELAKTIGTGFVNATGEGVRGLAALVKIANEALTDYQRIKKSFEEQTGKGNFGLGEIGPQSVAIGFGLGPLFAADQLTRQFFGARIQQQKDFEERVKQVQKEIAAEKELEEDAVKARLAARDKEEAAQKVQQERIEATLRQSHDAEIKRLDDLIQAEEFARQTKLDNLKVNERNELRIIEDVENARRKASDAELDRIQSERDDALDAAEDRKESALERIETEKEAAEAAAEAAIRQLNIEKETRQRTNEETKENTLARLEEEKEARDDLRTKEDRDIEDSVERRERVLEDGHRKTLRRLEREGEAVRERYDKEIREIDKREREEDRRQERRIRNIDEEARRRIKAIDNEIDRLEEAERQRDAIRRSRDLNQRLSDAQLALREATGTQDPIAREQAQGKLVAAIRLGDPVAIKKAQDELTEIVGRGTRAIEEAQRNLNNVQEDIRDNDLKASEDAQKKKLQDEKERIREEQEDEKRQASDRDKRRKDRLDRDKDAAKKTLDDALKKIEASREAEEDAHRASKRELDDLVEYNSRRLADRRREEDQFYEDATEAEQARYRQEQRDIEDTYDNEATGAIPAVRRALKATQDSYRDQAEEVNKRHKAEQKNIQDTAALNIANHRAFEEDARNTYQRIVDDTRIKYEEMRKTVERAYVYGDGKTGIIDKLQVLKDETRKKLQDVLTEFELHKKGLVGEDGIITTQWADAVKEAKKYFDYLDSKRREQEEAARNRRRTPGDDPLPGNVDSPLFPGPGGGPGGSTAPPSTSGDSGPQVESVQVHEVDMNPNRYTTTFGFKSRYNGIHATGPGWEPGNNAQWPNGPSHHKGIDLSAGFGAPIGSFTSGSVSSIHHFDGDGDKDPGGTYVVIDGPNGNKYWYMHLDSVNVKQGQKVFRGSMIGTQGWTGLDARAHTHLHFEVRSPRVHVNGPRSLQELMDKGIDPSPYIKGADTGRVFRNPTIYKDLRTGERGVLAELGAERLLGRRDTQTFNSMGLTARLRRPMVASLNYDAIGATMSSAQTVAQITNNQGDTFNYNGVAPEDIMKRWRNEQRQQRVLRGRN